MKANIHISYSIIEVANMNVGCFLMFLLGNIDVLSARSATAARGKFLFLNLLIYFILGRGGCSDSDIKSTLPSSKSSFASSKYPFIIIPSITRFRAREGIFLSESDQPPLPRIK